MNKENLIRYIDEKADVIEKAYNEVLDLTEYEAFLSKEHIEAINYVATRLKHKEIDFRQMRDEIKEIDL